MTLKSDAKFEEKLTPGSKMTWGIWWILLRAVASLEICSLITTFANSTWSFSLKSTEETSLMTLKKDPNLTDFSFEKWHEEFGELWSEQSKVWKFALWWATFVESVLFELKRYRGVVLWKMTYGFKNDISNLVNLHTSSWK